MNYPQDDAPISAAFAFQKGSEFLHLFNHNLKKLLEGGIIYKINKGLNLSCLCPLTCGPKNLILIRSRVVLLIKIMSKRALP